MSEEKKNPEAPTALEQIEALKETEEFKTLLKNSNEAYWKENIGKEIKGVYGNVDSVLKDVLGVEKNPNKKTTEQLKELLSDYKTLKEKQGKGSEEQKKQNSDELDLLKAKLEQLEKTIEQKDTALADQISKNIQGKVSSSIDSALAGKTFKPSYSDEDLKELISIRKNKLISRSKVIQNEDGTSKVIYYKDAEKTKPYTNTIGDPMTSKEVADLEFGSLFVQKKKGGNTPTTEDNVNVEGDAIAMDMSKVNTRQKFHLVINKMLAAQGHAANSKEFKKIKKATYEAYKVGELPLS